MIIKRILGYLGFDYCIYCGSKLECIGTKGHYDDEIWECPNCVV